MKKICTVNLAVAWILFGIGLYLVVLRTLGPGLQRMPGEPCDSRFSSFILEHGYLFLIGKVPSYFSAPFLYPIQNVISFSDNFLTTLPLYAVLRLFSLDRETAYQVWFAALFAMNYWICLYFVRKMGISPWSPALRPIFLPFPWQCCRKLPTRPCCTCSWSHWFIAMLYFF